MCIRRRAGAPHAAPVLLILGLFQALPPPGLRAQEPARSIETAFAELADAAGTRTGAPFPFDYQFLAFRAPESGGEEVRVWAAASVHAGRVRAVFASGWRYALGMRLELFRGDEPVASDTALVEHVLSANIPETTSEGFPLHASVLVLPGDYRYRLTVTDLNWEEGRSVNAVEGEVTVPALDAPRPLVSSVAIAADSGFGWRPAEGIALKLNAARVVRPDARPFVYYELYGLTPGGPFEAEVELVSGWAGRGEGARAPASRRPFRLVYRGTAPAEPDVPSRGVLRMDLTRTEPGPYEVRVRVTDLATGAVSATRRAVLEVQLEPWQPLMPVVEIAGPRTTAPPKAGPPAGGAARPDPDPRDSV